MKKLFTVLAILLFTTATFAQQPHHPVKNQFISYRNDTIIIEYSTEAFSNLEQAQLISDYIYHFEKYKTLSFLATDLISGTGKMLDYERQQGENIKFVKEKLRIREKDLRGIIQEMGIAASGMQSSLQSIAKSYTPEVSEIQCIKFVPQYGSVFVFESISKENMKVQKRIILKFHQTNAKSIRDFGKRKKDKIETYKA